MVYSVPELDDTNSFGKQGKFRDKRLGPDHASGFVTRKRKKEKKNLKIFIDRTRKSATRS